MSADAAPESGWVHTLRGMITRDRCNQAILDGAHRNWRTITDDEHRLLSAELAAHTPSAPAEPAPEPDPPASSSRRSRRA